VDLITLKAELDQMIRSDFARALRGQSPDVSKPFSIPSKPVEHARRQLVEINRRSKEISAILEDARNSIPPGVPTGELTAAIYDQVLKTLQASMERGGEAARLLRAAGPGVQRRATGYVWCDSDWQARGSAFDRADIP